MSSYELTDQQSSSNENEETQVDRTKKSLKS